MPIADEIAFAGQLIDAFALNAWRRGVAAIDSAGAGVPPEMQSGEVDEDGWVEWCVLPSTLKEVDLEAFEDEFRVQFPPPFRGYLLARFHLFDQLRSQQYGQQIFMTSTPAGTTLGPLRKLIKQWRPLIDAGFVPFAQWGDGWGPMCFDIHQRVQDGECPIQWMDHEVLIPLGAERCRLREAVLPLAQPLYGSCREFLVDVFGRGVINTALDGGCADSDH